MRWEQLLVLLVFLVWPVLQELAKKRARENAERAASLDEDDFSQQPHLPEWLPPQHTPQPLVGPVHTSPPPVPTSLPVPARKQPPRPLVRVQPKSPLPSPNTIRSTLRNREGFRQAMVHKVVLGQPRSLRPPH